MAKAKFDITTIDFKTEATKGLHAGVGVVDLAVETVKEIALDAQKRLGTAQKDAQKRFADVQKSVRGLDLEPQTLRTQATKEAAARRDLIEKRVAALQADAQKFVTANVETASDTYGDLAKRGETVVRKLRGETAQTVAPAGKVVRTAPAKKASATKAPAKKSTAKKSTAKKTSGKAAATGAR